MGTYTLRKDIDEVVLNCTVLDQQKRIVTSLDQQDFVVLENGKTRKITAFKQEDVPVSIGLLLDNSGSMQQKERAVSKASLDLLRASNRLDETFVVYFSEEAVMEQPFSSNLSDLERTLTLAHRSFGGTALNDAVNLSAHRLAQSAKHSKQLLIVITDGHDNASKSDLPGTIRAIQRLNGPIVYTIGLLYDTPGSEARQSRRVLRLLAEETGGIAFFPKQLSEIDAIAEEVARDIRNQYLVAFRPLGALEAAEYRTINVKASKKGLSQLTVRTRKGYAFNRTITK